MRLSIRRSIRRFFLALLALSIVLASALYYWTRTPIAGSLRLQGLSGPVQITRDSHGVVHIHADRSDEDVFFAMGFAQAQDRFWQMEFQRRIASGTLSEIFGPASLDKDRFLRTIGFYRAAQRDLGHLDEKTRAIISAYTAGVNAFLSLGRYPVEVRLLRYTPKPWTEVDSIAWQKMMAWNLEFTWQDKINHAILKETFGPRYETLLLDYPKDAPTILSREDMSLNTSASVSKAAAPLKRLKRTSSDVASAPSWGALYETLHHVQKDLGFLPAPGRGSNSWVLSGRWTQSGKPILANDPHLQLQAPNLWYLVELSGPNFYVQGASVPGLPAVIIGRNQSIAWGLTNVNPDAQDLYVEPENAIIETREESIPVRGQPPEMLKVRTTRHGPLISDLTQASRVGPRIAFRWVALENIDTSVSSFLRIMYAQNWKQFKEGLSYVVAPAQNVVYADTQGNIAYLMAGAIPIRKGWNGALPVPADGRHEWEGTIPFHRLPQVFNPQRGYVVTANHKVVPEGYPYSITFRWPMMPYRAQRILDLLTAQKEHTVEGQQRIQNDVSSLLWRDMKPLLMPSLSTVKRPDMQPLIDELEGWDGRLEESSRPAALFEFWYAELRKRFLTALQLPYPTYNLPGPNLMIDQIKKEGFLCARAEAKDCQQLVRESFFRAVSLLAEHQGDDKKWSWGRSHRVLFKLPALGDVRALGWLWNRSISTPGDDFTVNVGTFDLSDFHQTDGAGYRQIIDLGSMENSLYIQALGQSGHPFSRHYDDLMPLWRSGSLLSMAPLKSLSGTQTLTLWPSKPLKVMQHAGYWADPKIDLLVKEKTYPRP